MKISNSTKNSSDNIQVNKYRGLNYRELPKGLEFTLVSLGAIDILTSPIALNATRPIMFVGKPEEKKTLSFWKGDEYLGFLTLEAFRYVILDDENSKPIKNLISEAPSSKTEFHEISGEIYTSGYRLINVRQTYYDDTTKLYTEGLKEVKFYNVHIKGVSLQEIARLYDQ